MSKFNNPKQVILASQSPRRVALLKQMGFDCLVMPADIDETALANESPADYVLRLAVQKALAALKKLNGQQAHLPILAADTTALISASEPGPFRWHPSGLRFGQEAQIESGA